MPSNNGVQLLGRGGHTYCNSSFDNTPGGFPAVLGVIGGALSARAEAKHNWNMARDNAVRTGNHMNLPNGTHHINGFIVKVTDNNIIYKNPDTRESTGIVKKTGEVYSFSGL